VAGRVGIWAVLRVGIWAVLFVGRTKHDILAQSETRHDTINFRLCKHNTNERFVSCLGSWHDALHNKAHTLGRAWAVTTQRIAQ
jgi:hypothetical protein